MNSLKKAASDFLRDPPSGLWGFWASERLTGALLGLALAAGLVTLILPQKPVGIEGDPLAYGRWLAEVRSQLGAGHDLVRSLGLLDVGHSWGARLLLGSLALNAIISIAEHASRLAVALRHRSTAPEGEEQQEWRIPAATTDAIHRLRAYLEGTSWSVRSPSDDEASILAWRIPWRTGFTLLAYAGLLLALLGVMVNARWGWQEANLTASAGQVLSIAHDRRIELRKDSPQFDPGGSGPLASDQGERVTVLRDGESAAQLRLHGAWPRYFQGLLLRQTGDGPSILIDAEESDGQPVTLSVQPASPTGDASAELRFRDTGDEGYLLMPDADLTFRLTYYASAPWQDVDGPIIHVQAIRGGQAAPVWETSVQGNGDWSYQGMTFRTRSQRYAILRIDFAPGFLAIVAGAAVALVGLLALVLTPPTYSIHARRDQGECVLLVDATMLIRGPIARHRLARFRRDLTAILSE